MATKSERTKEALATAMQDMLLEMPYAKLTVRGVAARAGVDRQTFYYHFDTLDDLASYLCHTRLEALSPRASECADVREIFLQVLKQVEGSKALLHALIGGVGRVALREVFYDDVHAALRVQADHMLGEAARGMRAEEVDFAVTYCQYASVSMVIDWIEGTIDDSPRALADKLSGAFECHIRGLMA